MKNLWLRKTLSGFEPADDVTRETHRKYKVGEVYRAEIVKPRSYKHHCLCMALLNLTYENQERYQSFEIFRKVVAIEAGHVEDLIDLSGVVHMQAKSLSYDALDEVEFTKVSEAMMSVCARILGGMKLMELKAEVSKYASSHYGIAA